MPNNHIVDVSELLGLIAEVNKLKDDIKKERIAFNGILTTADKIVEIHHPFALKDTKWKPGRNLQGKPTKELDVNLQKIAGHAFTTEPHITANISGVHNPNAFKVIVSKITKTSCTLTLQLNGRKWENAKNEIATGKVHIHVKGLIANN